MIDWDTVGLVIGISLSVALFSVLVVGGILVVRDTIRRKGRWGVNTTLPDCPECGEPTPPVRKPANLRQALWGGHTCAACGCEYDKWGEPVDAGGAPVPAAEPLDEDDPDDDRPPRRRAPGNRYRGNRDV
jgi:hypothetical protein